MGVLHFIEGNYYALDTYSEYKKITHKVIESFIISYSMKDSYYNHLHKFNDFMIRVIITQCDPGNLIKWLQRYNISDIKYDTESKYLEKTIKSFFSEDNLDFLASEINFIDNRTSNPDLRRKTENYFKNICYILAYFEVKIEEYDFLKKVGNFILKTDVDVNTTFAITHPILRKPNSFSITDILNFIELIIDQKHTDSYIVTNCLVTLNEKDFKFSEENIDLIESIENLALEKPSYNLFSILPKVISEKRKENFCEKICSHLISRFNSEIFEEAIINDLIRSKEEFFEEYLNTYNSLKNSGSYLLFKHVSPYTGIDYRIAERLNNLVTVIYKLKYFNYSEHPIIKRVRELSPYYNYLLSDCAEQFEVKWLLENKSPIILGHLSENIHIKNCLETSLKQNFNKELGKIYLKYFCEI